jgi:DNA-binding response OmpR family regulator
MNHRVLIAEDDSNILTSIEFLLSQAGYFVTTANHGEQVWLALQSQPLDLAVLDVMLPGIDGLELCRRIRATDSLRTMRVLILSARGRHSEIEAGLKGGADAYMTKPFGTREFLATVARLLNDQPVA